MRIFHISDLHIGKSLLNISRIESLEYTLKYILEQITNKKCDVLLISGDIFDNSTPTHKSETIYYNFLDYLSKISTLKKVIIIAGNHDSANLLKTTANILKNLRISIITEISTNLEDEIVDIYDGDKLILRVLAVPYIRDKDVSFKKVDDIKFNKDKSYANFVQEHYQTLTDYAFETNKDNAPIIAMGHMFITNCSLTEDEQQNHIVGLLGAISKDIFDERLSYVALGHIHKHQEIVKNKIVYSGTPMPMTFSEAKYENKQGIVQVDIDENKEVTLDYLPIPVDTILISLNGTKDLIEDELDKLALNKDLTYIVEIILNEIDLSIDLSSYFSDYVQNNNYENITIAKVSDISINRTFKIYDNENFESTLNKLQDVDFVIESLLDNYKKEDKEEEKQSLKNTFYEILTLMQEQDNDIHKDK